MSYNEENEYAHLQNQPWSTMNETLYRVYEKLKKVLDDMNFFKSHEKYELPYFMAASKNYENSKYRIMVIAQETLEWGSEFSHNNNYNPINPHNFEVNDYENILRSIKYPDDILRALMILYDERVNKEWGVGGCLWQFYVNLRDELEKKEPYQFGLIHNNIAKIANRAGEKRNGVGSEYTLNESLIEFIKEEIIITNPHIIIFCVGNHHHYQDLLSNLNPQIAKLTTTLSQEKYVTDIQEYSICNSFRKVICCYHPRKLNDKKGGLNITTDEICSMILKDIKKNINSLVSR